MSTATHGVISPAQWSESNTLYHHQQHFNPSSPITAAKTDDRVSPSLCQTSQKWLDLECLEAYTQSNVTALPQQQGDAATPAAAACQTIKVLVPSSEHVSEIVGKRGQKIKSLRARTNTYIKTPQRNQEPAFIISGRPQDTLCAQRCILDEAEHFTYIRRHRHANSSALHLPPQPDSSGLNGLGGAPGQLSYCAADQAMQQVEGLPEPADHLSSSSNGGADAREAFSKVCSNGPAMSQGLAAMGTATGGQKSNKYITSFLKVPYNVVGLVVGPKGRTIKQIQESCGCYILTPNRSKEPIFEIYGQPQNVKMVKEQIYAHLADNLSGEEKHLLKCWDSEDFSKTTDTEVKPVPQPSETLVPAVQNDQLVMPQSLFQDPLLDLAKNQQCPSSYSGSGTVSCFSASEASSLEEWAMDEDLFFGEKILKDLDLF